MSLRISRIVVSLVLLDDFDGIQEAQPIAFQGDADGPAADKLAAWLRELPAKLSAAAEAESAPKPNRAARRADAR